jgi:uncharacterized protein (DUF2267 family)
MATEFDKYAQKGNEFLSLLENDLKVPSDKAFRILKSVLHTLRNHLGFEESLKVIAQLPMALKGIYVDQWTPGQRSPRMHHVKQLLDEIRESDKSLAAYDFGDDETAKSSVRAVFRTLNYFLSDGEFEDITAVFATEIKEFITGSIGQGRMAL